MEKSLINLKNDKHIIKVTTLMHDMGKGFSFFHIEYSLRPEINNFAVQLDFWDRVI